MPGSNRFLWQYTNITTLADEDLIRIEQSVIAQPTPYETKNISFGDFKTQVGGGGNVPNPTAIGQTIYADTASTYALRDIGTTGQVYTVDATGVPVWANAPGGTVPTPTADGQILVGSSGGTYSLLNQGAEGQHLSVVSGVLAYEDNNFNNLDDVPSSYPVLSGDAKLQHLISNTTSDGLIYTQAINYNSSDSFRISNMTFSINASAAFGVPGQFRYNHNSGNGRFDYTTANDGLTTRSLPYVAGSTDFEILTAGGGSNFLADDGTYKPGGAGEVNTASNLGGGEGVFAQKVSQDLQFKSLVAGTNVSLSSTSTEITINSTGGGGGILTTKGDLLSHNGTNEVRKPVGSENSLLLANSSQTDGLLWFASIGQGDLLIGNTTSGWTRLSLGTNNQVLKSNGTTTVWDDLAFTDLSDTPSSYPVDSGDAKVQLLVSNTTSNGLQFLGNSTVSFNTSDSNRVSNMIFSTTDSAAASTPGQFAYVHNAGDGYMRIITGASGTLTRAIPKTNTSSPLTLTTNGGGSNFLADDGTYKSASGGVNVYKTTDENRISTTTVAADNELFLNVEANKNYQLIIELIGNGASLTPGFVWDLDVPTGTTGYRTGAGNDLSSTAQIAGSQNLTLDYAFDLKFAGEPVYFRSVVYLDVGGTPGSVNFRWAQAVSDANASILKAGCSMTLVEVI